MPHDAVQIRVLHLQDLVQPVLQFHMRMSAQLAESRGAFHGPVGQR